MAEKQPAPTAEIYATWLTPEDAIKCATKSVGADQAKEAIWTLLQAGLIAGISSNSSRSQIGYAPTLTRTLAWVPNQVWTYFRHTATDFWRTGIAQFVFPPRVNTDITNTLRCTGIRLNPKDIRAGLPEPPEENAGSTPKLPDVSPDHLQAWFTLYQRIYEGSPVDTRAHQLKSAQGMFPDKSVSRDRVRKLFENRTAGRRPNRKDE